MDFSYNTEERRCAVFQSALLLHFYHREIAKDSPCQQQSMSFSIRGMGLALTS